VLYCEYGEEFMEWGLAMDRLRQSREGQTVSQLTLADLRPEYRHG